MVLIAESAVVLPPKAAWKNLHFNKTQLREDSVSGDASDPDLDGCDNHFEWVFAMDPGTRDLPDVRVEIDETGAHPVIYQRAVASAAEIGVEVSTQLQDREPPAPGMTETLVVNPDLLTDTVTLHNLRPLAKAPFRECSCDLSAS